MDSLDWFCICLPYSAIENCHSTKLSMPTAIIILLINAVLPGIGTVVAGLAAKDLDQRTGCLIVGLIQVLTIEMLIGVIWAWYFSILMVINASK